MKNLENKVALVTGAGRGIGRCISRQLSQCGAVVICVSKSADSCKSVAEEIMSEGGKAEHFQMDVSNQENVKSVGKEILNKYESIDILVNNAGITCDKLFLRMTDEDWSSVLLTNLFSAFYVCKEFIQGMISKRYGRIINMTSVAGITGNAGQVNYSSAKAGLIGFTKSLAKEVASRSITVNAVAPGFIDTQMTQKLSADIVEQAKKLIPTKRFGTSDEIANVVSFLASTSASYITGQVITVDGGMNM